MDIISGVNMFKLMGEFVLFCLSMGLVLYGLMGYVTWLWVFNCGLIYVVIRYTSMVVIARRHRKRHNVYLNSSNGTRDDGLLTSILIPSAVFGGRDSDRGYDGGNNDSD